jgi:hypothetical protein
MLSLSPRYDLFRFSLPKDFLPEEIESKYSKVIRSNQSVITTPIDYLNESIQGVSFPGIADVIITQGQQGSNDISRKNRKTNFEPKMNMIYQTPENVLDKIDRSFKVTFRMNQGFYNYFMVYETLFHQVCKPLDRGHQPVYYIELLNEVGEITARILFKNVLIDGIDGLEFNFNKIERDSGTFDVNFKFANIDFEFVDKL